MYFLRHVEVELASWRKDPNKKPMLVRGARQVGKTRTIRHFSNQFENYLEINFESEHFVHALFESDDSIDNLIENLSTLYNVEIEDDKTLIFFDEIQVCIPAIQSLRYLYEKRPNLHVIAAGSLLEFALVDIPSFGVGRIRSLYMHPMSFDEFLLAMNEKKLLQLKNRANKGGSLPKPFHEKLLNYVKKFLLIGGMPEVVSTYIQTKSIAKTRLILDDLINAYYDDFAKYKKRVPPQRIKDVFNSVVMQAGKKFIYSKTLSLDNSKQIKEALELLILAGLVIPVTHTHANGLPLGAEANHKRRKTMLLDIGLFLRILNLDLSEIILEKDFNLINKGSLTEIFVGLELIKYQSPYQKPALYYWHREAKSSNAEVDFVYAVQSAYFPIEVKSGTKGSMQSMKLFLEEKKLGFGVRISMEYFSAYDGIMVIPLYAVRSVNEVTLDKT